MVLESDIKFGAQDAIERSRRLLDRIGGNAQTFLDVVDASHKPSELARAVGLAAAKVAEETEKLEQLLADNKLVLNGIEMQRTRVAEAQANLEKALQQRASERSSRESEALARIGGARDGRERRASNPESAEDAYERMRAEDRAASMAPLGAPPGND